MPCKPVSDLRFSDKTLMYWRTVEFAVSWFDPRICNQTFAVVTQSNGDNDLEVIRARSGLMNCPFWL